MRNKNFLDVHGMVRVEDKCTFLYLDRCKIVQDELSVAAYKDSKKIVIPLAAINVLLLGPGTSITQSAMRNVVSAGCTALWCGDNVNYIYATGMCNSDYSKNLIIQAKCYSDREKHLSIVRRMYQARYQDTNLSKFSLEQMRGMEGKRMKAAYEKAAIDNNIQWNGRVYDQDDWDNQDSVNQMLSVGNNILYSICHAAVIAFGFSPGLGFIHNGGSRSFVFDIADLYKERCIIPAAFKVAAEKGSDIELMRKACRESFYENKLMKCIANDLSGLFTFGDITAKTPVDVGLWDINDAVQLGKNYGK